MTLLQINIQASTGLGDALNQWPASPIGSVRGDAPAARIGSDTGDAPVPSGMNEGCIGIDVKSQVHLTLKVSRLSVLDAAEKNFGLRRSVAQVRTIRGLIWLQVPFGFRSRLASGLIP